MTSHFLNQQGIAKVCHEPDWHRHGVEKHHYVIYILPHMAWEPMQVFLRFPTRQAAEDYLKAVYDKVTLVKEKYFNALCRNLSVLPKSFSNCD